MMWKGGSYFKPARCLEGDGGSQGSYRAVCWSFPSIQWKVGTGALWQRCARGTDNRVAGSHIVASLGCQAPGIRYRQLACPRGPRSGSGYGVRLGEGTKAGRTIKHRDLLRAGDVGEAGGLEVIVSVTVIVPVNVVAAWKRMAMSNRPSDKQTAFLKRPTNSRQQRTVRTTRV
jgi:hypothetical protein